MPALTVLMDAAIAELQRGFLDDAQISSSKAIMGIDTQLIDDGTYFVVESDGDVAGCGGWSRRATLYGGNQTPGRDSNLLDPKRRPGTRAGDVHAPGLCPEGCGPSDPVALRDSCGVRGLHATRADVHARRRAALHRVRVPANRTVGGCHWRRSRPARPDGEAASTRHCARTRRHPGRATRRGRPVRPARPWSWCG